MGPLELRDFLYQEIPMARALEVQVVGLTAQAVELRAPLAPSRNHLETAFGGSLGAVMILACYSWLFHRLACDGKVAHVLIQSAHTDYLRPVAGEIRARCLAPDENQVQRMLEHFQRKGMARLTLTAQVIDAHETVLCQFTGDFVARNR